MKLKILTINLGLLELRFFGLTIFKSPAIEERLTKIPQELIKKDADIIAIQEVYDKKHKKILKKLLKPHYPFIITSNRGGIIGLKFSLMLFSKFPISAAKIKFFKCESIGEKIFDSKGFITAIIKIDSHNKLRFVNIHTTAGGALFHPESQRTNSIRQKQLNQVFQSLKSSEKIPTILLGDFNAGPNVSEENYTYLLKQGFIDIVQYYITKNNYKDDFISWDPNNFLNAELKIFKTSPPQRIDHILLSENFFNMSELIYVKTVFDEKVVCTKDGQNVTISDHYGLLACIDF